MTRVGLLGDTHGNANVILASLKRFQSQGIDQIFQLGDFGFWPGKHGSAYLAFVNTQLGKYGVTMYVTPGNHDDYTQINSWHVFEDGWMRARQHVLVAPRGHRWEIDGRTFVSLGGAPSVDRDYRIRTQRRTSYPIWWKEEDITREDMDKTTAGGHADIMLAHDAPFGVPMIESGISGNPYNFTETDLRYGYEGRKKMEEVVDLVRPTFFFHGHYHFKVHQNIEIFNENTGVNDVVQVRGLTADGALFSEGILDLESMTFKFWGQDGNTW